MAGKTSRDPWRPAETPRDQWRPLETSRDPWRPAESMHIKAIQFITVSDHETVLSFDVDRDETSSTYWNASYISFRYELSASCPTRKHILRIDISHCTCVNHQVVIEELSSIFLCMNTT